MSAPKKKRDPDVSNALAMAWRLEFLAGCLDPDLGSVDDAPIPADATPKERKRIELQRALGRQVRKFYLEDGGAAVARKRIQDAHAAAWRYLAGTHTNAERVRLVRRAVIDAAEAHGSEPRPNLDRAVGHACSRVAIEDPELGARMWQNRKLVERAVRALWRQPYQKAEVRSADAMRDLLKALKLPSSARSGKGREPSGRAWPVLSFKRPPKHSTR